MVILDKIRNSLIEPRLRGVDYESSEVLQVHRRILFEKEMLREVHEFYRAGRDIDEKYFKGQGARVEIGTGVSIFKHFYPDTVVTDIKRADHLDRVIDAQNMDCESHSIRAIYGINCFHHYLPS